MNFVLTRYIYPIENPILISNRFRLRLDNPRTQKEIDLILTHLKTSMDSPSEVYAYDTHSRIPINASQAAEGTLTVESALENFEKNYSNHDDYLKSYFIKVEGKDYLEKLARMWVIARFDDEGEFERLDEHKREMNKEGSGGFILIEEGNPIVDNCDILASYSYLLTLLLTADHEDSHGGSFLLHHDSYDLQFPKVSKHINSAILYFGFTTYSIELIHEDEKWTSFYHIRDKLIKTSELLESVIDDSNQDKILYIAKLLKVADHDISDVRYKLVTLVSIVELLLTHSPNYQRFNVEDSISKQFRLKTSILVYQNDKSKSLEWIKSRLKDIYNQRSNIAHGNFKSLTDYLTKEAKKLKGEDYSEEVAKI